MIGQWLISPDGAAAVKAAHRQLVTAEQVTAFEARVVASVPGAPRIMKAVDGVAEISITGVLTERPDFFSAYYGGGNTTFSDIRASLLLAQADASIKEVLLQIASPGGTVEGLFETLNVIEAFDKPMRVQASFACSAAYAIAAAGGKISATTEASMFGSIGVAVSLFVDDSTVDITNTESPAKRPNVSTPEGKAVIQAELDAIYELFAKAIARGRGTTVERVTADFGRGATLLSTAAKAAGMIDAVATAAKRARGASAQTESLATLLSTRLPEETAEQYTRRCLQMLEQVSRREPARLSAPGETLVQALVRVGAELPPAFAHAVPPVSDGLVAALATPSADDEREPTLEELAAAIAAQGTQADRPAAPTRDALAAAVARADALTWEDV